MSATTQSETAPSGAKLRENISFTVSAEYQALSDEQKRAYVRNDACGHGYAWGRIDAGDPPVVSVTEGQGPSNSDTVWVFGGLYARMLLELHDPAHPRTFGFSLQLAWDTFVETGCPEGHLPLRLTPFRNEKPHA